MAQKRRSSATELIAAAAEHDRRLSSARALIAEFVPSPIVIVNRHDARQSGVQFR